MIDMEPVVTAAILMSIAAGLLVLTTLVVVGWALAPSIRHEWVALRGAIGRPTAHRSHHARIAH